MNSDFSAQNFSRHLPMVLVGFSLVCFLTALFFNTDQGDERIISFDAQAYGDQGQGKAFEVESKNQVFLVTMERDVSGLAIDRGWVDVDVQIQSANAQTLFGYAINFFREYRENTDGDTYLYEQSEETVKITMPYSGTFRIHMFAQSNQIGDTAPITVRMQPKVASSMPFFLVGIIAIVAGIALGFINIKMNAQRRYRY